MRVLSLFGGVADASRLGYLRMLTEILRLRLMPGALGVSEYFDFRLYEPGLSFAEKACFCGYRGQATLEQILVDDYSKILTLDKLTFYQLMRANGFPVPELRAIYANTSRGFPGRCLATAADLSEYLSGEMLLPLYVKRAFGAYGRGNTVITGRDGSALTLGDGSRVGIADFCRSLGDASGFGWLFQEALQSHSSIARICGDRVSGLRVHAFLGRDAVHIHRLVWKINSGRLESDNFTHGRSGNLLADIDTGTGEVTRVVSGVGRQQNSVEHHPATGARLIGFRLPFFDEALELVKRATLVFPGFICPGWDVALSSRGPVLLEVNAFGDVDLSQHASRRGFMDAELLALMRSRGLDHYVREPVRASFRCATGRRGWRNSHWPY
jgi:hypothetical protein